MCIRGGLVSSHPTPRAAPWWQGAWQLDEVRRAVVAVAAYAVGLALDLLGAATGAWLAAYLVTYVVGGWTPTREGLEALRERRLDVDVLMVVAAIAAASIGQWADGALLIAIFATSGALEEVVTGRAEKDLRSLLDLAPDRAERLDDAGRPVTVDAATLRPGDHVLVRPGARVPADGTVTEGRSDLDQASLTGEPLPVPRGVGDEVLAGSVNGDGPLVVRVGRDPADAVIARVARQVEEAAAAKAPTQLTIERFEQRYALGVVVATLLYLTLPWLVLGWAFEETLLRAMTFMIVASPCAVVLATMPPLLAAVARAGRAGVLVRGAVVVEQLAEVDAVAFDKTGTVTTGRPDVVAIDSDDRDRLLALAAAAEARADHPAATAIVAAARDAGVTVGAASDVQALPGRGVAALVGGDRVAVGNASLVADLPDGCPHDDEHTTVGVSVDDRLLGSLCLADRTRTGAPTATAALRELGVRRQLLLTGDREVAARALAAELGIDEVRGGLLPEDKTAELVRVRDAGHRTLFVGDGVNDGPALATADVGVAMGAGTAVALDAADVVLLRDDVRVLPELVALARRARRLVRQNLVIAGVFIVVLVALDLAGQLPLPIGVAAHEGSTVLVALNGLRILRG
ncbi:cadmium-translocating P-type ATPase [Nitriliruptoraceae bacterium ZYF776]|nr:cadmium-translocating P-type ATPase [Profundirhabdus halotolerans]